METATVMTSVPTPVPAPVKNVERDTTKWLRKTKLCVYSIQGTCRLGSACLFAHSAAEVQEAPNLHKTQLCPAFAAGDCSNENCSFAHGEEELRLSPKFKNKICKWYGKGLCRNGAGCSFAHGGQELRGDPTAPQSAAIAPPPGLTLPAPEVKAPMVLELEGSLLDVKVPPSAMEFQLEGMTAQIATLQMQIDEMVLLSHVSSMEKVLSDLTGKVAELDQSSGQTAPTDKIAAAPWKKKKTPLRTALSSKATPFQPFTPITLPTPVTWSPQAQPFKPSCPAGETDWPSDDSTSVGSGGFSSD